MSEEINKAEETTYIAIHIFVVNSKIPCFINIFIILYMI